MTISYYAGDERPAWVPTVTVNGVTDDLSTGHTFQVKVIDRTGAVVLTKTTNITGATGGVVTVAWAPNELALPEGGYTAQLKASRTADSAEWTVTEPLHIKPRY